MQHLLFIAKNLLFLIPRVHLDRSGIVHIVQPVALETATVDQGLFLSRHAIQRQLGAMPHELYLVRLIHHASGRACPGERLWTAQQIAQAATVGFLRVRNREGCDVYLQPFAGDCNAGYILVDLDHAEPAVRHAPPRA